MTDSATFERLKSELAEIESAGLYKRERQITTPQRVAIETAERGEVLNFCANNYLGLADNPEIIDAAKQALDDHGFGMASVRFICGTQDLHKQLEKTIADFTARKTRFCTRPASTPTAACSSRCWVRKTRSFPTRSTTPRSSTASACARPSGTAIRTRT